MMMAQKCLDFIRAVNENEVEDEWQDVFLRYAGLDPAKAPWLVDLDATTEADPSGRSDIVIFLDGSRLYWDETDEEWRVG